jgi:cohesin domain-containing protein
VRRILVLLISGCLIGLLPPAVRGQNSMLLSLETTSNSVQTGTTYEVSIRLDDAAEVWLADMQIHYDPAMVYVIGTKAGSPVSQGALFDSNASAVIRNEVQGDTLLYTLSMLAPADPVSGSGIVGTLRIYPLAPGQTQLTFSRGELDKAIFEDRDGQRVGVGSEQLPFTPVLLDLTITGGKVEPPSEATATPPPTETLPPQPTVEVPTEIPTLVNVTAAPRTPEPLATLEAPTASTDSRSSLPLILAIAVMLVGGTGTIVAFVLMRRRK